MKNQNPIWITQANCPFDAKDKRMSLYKFLRIKSALRLQEKTALSFSLCLKKFNLQNTQVLGYRKLRFYYMVGMCRSKIIFQMKRYNGIEAKRKLKIHNALKYKSEKLRKKAAFIEFYLSHNIPLEEVAKSCKISLSTASKWVTAYFERPEYDIVLPSKINFM